ncbi:hypothetical protein Cgig2_018457 [Carnegiea gigantea]|uniref:Uncharacterized protein n=1 Tax=Carnegiea gigantea TaxID=171969 RepID=A0A9Q1QE81_9CARY|nr:hypothetical protein Cgig2_018457 [Carnegiea gigantea]
MSDKSTFIWPGYSNRTDPHALVRKCEKISFGLEDFICEVRGDRGFREAIVDCYKCQDAYVHCYCFYDKSKIWVEHVLWACGDCEPFNPDEHLPEEEPPTYYQAAEAEQGVTQKLRQREDHLDKQNDGNKGGNSANFPPVDSPTGGTEPGQSSGIQKKKGK